MIWIERDITTLTATRQEPVARSDLAMVCATVYSGASTILLRSVDHIRKMIVCGDVIELRRRLVVPGGPGLAVIEADRGSLIRPKNHARRVFRIDPQLVIIISTRRAANDGDRFAAVFAAIQRH